MNPLVDADYFLTLANQTMWVLALAAAPILSQGPPILR